MSDYFSFPDFVRQFPDDEACWEEIRKRKFPQGIYCVRCKRSTTHYKLAQRPAYSCAVCRHHLYLLSGTIFEKSTTSLRKWFYAMYLMTQTQGNISVVDLHKELLVTYKTAWRMYHLLISIMQQEDQLLDPVSRSDKQVRKWVFFNTIEIQVAHKEEKVE